MIAISVTVVVEVAVWRIVEVTVAGVTVLIGVEVDVARTGSAMPWWVEVLVGTEGDDTVPKEVVHLTVEEIEELVLIDRPKIVGTMAKKVESTSNILVDLIARPSR